MSVTENTNRAVFGLHGITGMLIATVLLLGILVFLTMSAMSVQQKSATNFYDPAPIVSNLDNVKMRSEDNKNFAFKDAK